jgi:hypothetical protein
MNYLPQATIVERLLNLVGEVLPNLPDNALKQRLLSSLKDFEVAITPSTIYLEEVYQWAAIQNIKVSQEQAITILEDAALDIDFNYVSDAVEYHVDEHIRTVEGDYDFK